MEIGYAKSADGTKIWYGVTGEGPPIILVYGITCSVRHWDAQIRYFKKKHKVIVYDLRGHPKSESPIKSENLTLDHCVNDIKAVMKAVGIRKAMFAGHSYGLTILLKAYERHPAMFKKLVSIEGLPGKPFKTLFGTGKSEQVFEIFKLATNQFPKQLDLIWKKVLKGKMVPVVGRILGFNPTLTKKDDVKMYLEGISRITPETFVRLMEDAQTFDGEKILPRLKIPTLYIAGARDLLVPPAVQKRMHKMTPGSEILSIPYGSHFAHIEFHEFANLKMDAFFSK